MNDNKTNTEIQFQTLPMLGNERPWSFYDNCNINIGFAIATWCFMIGGTLALFVNIYDAIIATLAGNIIGVFLVMFATIISSAKYGIEQYTISKSWLGRNGLKLVFCIIVLTQVAWVAVLNIMFGRSIENIISSLFHFTSSGTTFLTAVSLFCLFICLLVVWKGPLVMKVLNIIVAPMLIIVMIGMVILLSKYQGGWAAIMNLNPTAPVEGGRIINFLIALELNVGAGVSWWPSMGGIARLCKTTRAAYWPNMIGLVLAATLGTIIGVATSLVFGEMDPTKWMIPLGGAVAGVIALIFIAIANITSATMVMYNATLGMLQFRLFGKMNRGLVIVIFALAVAILLFFPYHIYSNFYILLGLITVFFVPVTAIQIVDYFFLRKRKIDLVQVFNNTESSRYNYWKGFNLVALFVIATSCIVYLQFFDPIFLTTTDLFQYTTATGATFVYSVIAYYILGKIFLVKKNIGGYKEA